MHIVEATCSLVLSIYVPTEFEGEVVFTTIHFINKIHSY